LLFGQRFAKAELFRTDFDADADDSDDASISIANWPRAEADLDRPSVLGEPGDTVLREPLAIQTPLPYSAVLVHPVGGDEG
jgi:hypothetical protein